MSDPDLAELAIAGFDNHLYYSWPMTRLVVQASRLTAVHAEPTRGVDLNAELPGARITADPARARHARFRGADPATAR